MFKLLIDLPFLPKGSLYDMDIETGHVYMIEDNGDIAKYPLRDGLAGYLWMLRMEKEKYLKRQE